jgi:hypothetical protein
MYGKRGGKKRGGGKGRGVGVERLKLLRSKDTKI